MMPCMGSPAAGPVGYTKAQDGDARDAFCGEGLEGLVEQWLERGRRGAWRDGRAPVTRVGSVSELMTKESCWQRQLGLLT